MATQPPAYYGSIPTIATAYQNDPRTKLASSLLAQGTAGNPVAQGAWGVPDGLAHVAQAIAGALAQKQNDKKYGAREQGYMSALKESLAPPSAPGGAPVDPSAAVASALAAPPPAPGAGAMPAPGMALPPAPGMAPPAAMAPPAVMAGPPGTSAPMTPGGGAGGLPVGAMPPPPGMGGPPPAGMPPARTMAGGIPGMLAPGAGISGGPARTPINSIGGGGVQPPGFTGAKQGGLNSLALYRTGIVPIEGGTGQNGRFLTSPKGAIGPGQIMPETGPEAARLAGLPFDAQRLRTDADYNNALGAAYYGKKLQDFNGDPLKAAAAYNAGSGRVNRAIRTASRTGSDWRDSLPPETQTYVANFMQKTGIGSNGQPITPSRPFVPNAQQENVPDALAAPAQRPTAPPVPAAVQSQRMEIARRMLNSNNPDLVALAQSYLDKGLTENQDAAVTRNAQEYGRENLGYTSDLNDFNAQRSDVRAQQVADRTTALNHNFTSGERVASEQFTAGQSAAERTQNLGIANMQEAGQNSRFAQGQAGDTLRTQMTQTGDTERTKLIVAGKQQSEAEKRQQVLANYFNTPQGAKLADAAQQKINTNQDAIGKYQRFLQLNKQNSTGGLPVIGGGSDLVRGAQGHLPGGSDIYEMNSIAADTTLANLGGSLGVAISDGDRKFVSGSNISTSAPYAANAAIANARIKALQRSGDYEQSMLQSHADGSTGQFIRDWGRYINDVSIRTPGEYLSFDEWKQHVGSKK